MDLGGRIFELRKKQQFSQEKLGERVGVTRQTISNWELNETLPDTNQLIALSKALVISIDELVGNDVQNLLQPKVVKNEEKNVKDNDLIMIIIILFLIIIGLIVTFVITV
ncbi:MAG: helix-turn-helix transcriptional regulator [Clostridia bacterium]|nr:helix-turn-helix transcriptional regulator [Clostridia bacterium]MCI9275204.1 helix-turn-helix transcriptional regulator [Clostridia bacterium]